MRSTAGLTTGSRPGGDDDAAWSAIENDCLERVSPVICGAGGAGAALLGRYLCAGQRCDLAGLILPDLQFFAGRRYSGQRNHINKFRSKWPDAQLPPDGGGRTGDRAVLAGL